MSEPSATFLCQGGKGEGGRELYCDRLGRQEGRPVDVDSGWAAGNAVARAETAGAACELVRWGVEDRRRAADRERSGGGRSGAAAAAGRCAAVARAAAENL